MLQCVQLVHDARLSLSCSLGVVFARLRKASNAVVRYDWPRSTVSSLKRLLRGRRVNQRRDLTPPDAAPFGSVLWGD